VVEQARTPITKISGLFRFRLLRSSQNQLKREIFNFEV
jgi:hypothetical protein